MEKQTSDNLKGKSRKVVTDMTAAEARKFFLKASSYVNIDLPEYFDFQPVLDAAREFLRVSGGLSRKNWGKLKNLDVNYTILLNKDSKYDWRPIQIVNPFVYVDIVNFVTEENNWGIIQERFQKFREYEDASRIACLSMPAEYFKPQPGKRGMLTNWWETMEQASIENALDYSYCIKLDITNCYGSIYTHTIDWAIRGKEKAKKDVGVKVGAKLDKKVRDLQRGQTNGIPQGAMIFDFIAEIVLGYSDLQLSKKLSNLNDKGWKILRYRDDYRIFTKKLETAESIVKELSDVLSDLNMHFNSKKTDTTQDIIESAIKPDKIYWNFRAPIIQNSSMGLQKHLLEILWLSKRFPNSSRVGVALVDFAKRLDGIKKSGKSDSKENSILPLISIVVNILSNNPKAIPAGVGVLSKLLAMNVQDKCTPSDIVRKIRDKLRNTPNLNYLDIWLQRLEVVAGPREGTQYSEKLCESVKEAQSNDDHQIELWDCSFMPSAKGELPSVVDKGKLSEARLEILTSTFDVFSDYDG